MRALPLVFSAVLWFGCDGPKGPTTPITTDSGTSVTTTTTVTLTTTTNGACGDITRHNLTINGAVVLETGRPAVGAFVELADRGWAPGTVLGSAVTDGDGLFQLLANNVTSVEDCWGTLLDYVLEAENATEYGELPVNTELYGAIVDGTNVADVTSFPVEMEAQ